MNFGASHSILKLISSYAEIRQSFDCYYGGTQKYIIEIPFICSLKIWPWWDDSKSGLQN